MIFSDLYDVAFPNKEIEIKNRYLNTPSITKELRKSSKRKQSLYDKYLRLWSKENTKTYKNKSRELKNMQRKIIIEIKSKSLKLKYEIQWKI